MPDFPPLGFTLEATPAMGLSLSNLALTVSRVALRPPRSSAEELLVGEGQGVAIDFADADGAGLVYVRDIATPENNKEDVPVDELVANATTSAKLVTQPSGLYGWTPHNLFLNSAAPATQNVTIISGATYTVSVTGPGSLAGSSGASGTATEGSPATFVATGTTGIFTKTGDLASIQINRGAVPTDYVETAGAREFLVPFEYRSGWRGLVEPSAVNSTVQFTGWDGKTNATLTANAAIAPNGEMKAWKIEASSAAVTNVLDAMSGAGAASGNTYQLFVKKGTGPTTANRFRLRNATTAADILLVLVNYDTGEITYLTGSAGVSMVALPDDWWALSLSATSGISAGDQLWIYAGFTGGAAAAGDHLFAWVPQLEPGLFATSPIPTFGSTVTRAADAPNFALSTIPFSAAVGTIYLKARTPRVAGTNVLWQFDDGTANERIRIERNSSNEIHCIVTDGGSPTCDINLGAVAHDTDFQVTFAWAEDDFAASLDGGAVETASSGALPTVTTARLGYSASGEQWNSTVETLVYAPRRVPDADVPDWRYAA